MFKRSGVWWTCIRYKGKKIQKSLETSDKRLARAIDAKIRAEIVEGKYFEKPKFISFSVEQLVRKYLDEHSKPNKKEETFKTDISCLKKILQHFGKLAISEVKPRHISKFIKIRRADGVSDTMINHELRLLRHAYNLAINSWELIEETPFAKIKIPRGDVRRVRYLSEDEEKRLFAVLSPCLVPIVTIARETGLRLSNIANLTWEQVNFFNRMIIVETTKNGDPVGIPMTEKVNLALRDLNKIRRLDSDYIFGKNGKPFSRWWISKSFKKVCKKAGIENFRFHDLRHDFCSRLVQRGVDLYTVAALAGHRNLKTTQRYAHLSPEKLKSGIEALNFGHNLDTMGSSGKNQIL